jgi:3-methyl-2-oxobutanoate hydroxymethyltransferase
MSATGGAGGAERIIRYTVADIARMYADGRRIPTVTAFDYPSARLADEAGIPLILVGDSLAQVVLGYETTVRVSLDEMIHHTRAVMRGARKAIVVGDMPFLTYPNPADALSAAGRFLQEGGCQAVKVEGGRRTAPIVETLVRNGVPVMGHIGLTPQAINAIGKVRVQGKTKEQARALMADALAIAEAGAFAIVLELIPEQLAAAITDRLRIPTIGIGAGPECSGQIQLYTDILGLSVDHLPRHSRRYLTLRESIADALKAYAADVEAGAFPAEAETVRMDDDVLDEVLGRSHLDISGAAAGAPGGIIPLDRDL